MKKYQLKGIHCKSCSRDLEKTLNLTLNDNYATIDYTNHTLMISEETDVEKVKQILTFEKIAFAPKEELSRSNEQAASLPDGHGNQHAHSHEVKMTSGDKASRNVKIVFFVNAIFAVIEFIFGTLFNSVAILTDAVHDTGDAISIGLAWFFQKISTREANEKFSFGHQRFSLLGALITAVVLLGGSTILLIHTVPQLFNPEPVNYQGMFWLSIFAIAVKLFCMWLMNQGSSQNENLLNMHMLEDTLGWIGVFVVSIVLHITDWYILDPILSMAIAIFIMYKTWPLFKETVEIFLEASPRSIDVEELENRILDLSGVKATSHFHLWSIDGEENALTVTICVSESDPATHKQIKEEIRRIIYPYNVTHSTIEIVE